MVGTPAFSCAAICSPPFTKHLCLRHAGVVVCCYVKLVFVKKGEFRTYIDIFSMSNTEAKEGRMTNNFL